MGDEKQKAKGKALRALTLSGCAAMALAFGAPAMAQASAGSQNTEFQIPAQNLETALSEYARQSGQQLLFSPEIVRGKRANAVVGDLDPMIALDRLLDGSGLTRSHSPSGTILIQDSGRAPLQSPTRLGARDSSASSEEEIIVTAQKRAERLVDAPQSVSVIGAGELERTGATQLRDIASSVPGLSLQTAGAGWTQVSLRGVTAGFDVSPTVAIYVDDVPYGSTTSFARSGQMALDVGLFDLDRIEVLRGPQGTLYGASTMGGLIKYVTQAPDPLDFGGAIRAGLSSTEHGGLNHNLSGVLNLPLAEGRAALRISGFNSHDDGYIDNLSLGVDDVNQSDIYGGRIDLLLTPTDRLDIRLTAFEQHIESDGFPLTNRTLAGAPVSGELTQSRPSRELFGQRFQLFAGTIGYDFGGAQLTSITSFQTVSTEFEVDISAVMLPFATPSAVAVSVAPSLTETDKFTQEIRLSSTPDEGSFDWILGAFYTQEDSNDGTGLTSLDAAGRPVETLLLSNVPSTFEEYALFGDVTWRLTDKFDLTGGVRYASYSDEFEQIQSGPFGVSAPATSGEDDIFTYLAVARYHFGEDTMAYFRYATGYRPGGPNFRVASAPTAPTSFDADQLQSYELGFKTQTADRRFGFDASLYYIDWSDLQVTVSIAGFAFRDNASGGATSQGLDLALRARPTDNLTLTAALGYQDATMNEATPSLRAAAGERLPNVPEFSGALSADYEFDASYQPTIGASVRYTGERMASYNAATSPPQYQLDAYTTVDLRAGLTLGNVDARLFVNNLTDERGEIPPRISGSTPAAGPYDVGVIQPRTIGVSLATHF